MELLDWLDELHPASLSEVVLVESSMSDMIGLAPFDLLICSVAIKLTFPRGLELLVSKSLVPFLMIEKLFSMLISTSNRNLVVSDIYRLAGARLSVGLLATRILVSIESPGFWLSKAIFCWWCTIEKWGTLLDSSLRSFELLASLVRLLVGFTKYDLIFSAWTKVPIKDIEAKSSKTDKANHWAPSGLKPSDLARQLTPVYWR